MYSDVNEKLVALDRDIFRRSYKKHSSGTSSKCSDIPKAITDLPDLNERRLINMARTAAKHRRETGAWPEKSSKYAFERENARHLHKYIESRQHVECRMPSVENILLREDKTIFAVGEGPGSQTDARDGNGSASGELNSTKKKNGEKEGRSRNKKRKYSMCTSDGEQQPTKHVREVVRDALRTAKKSPGETHMIQ